MKEEIINSLKEGHEIELTYKGKNYSFTWVKKDDKVIPLFCEFYKQTISADSIDELVKMKYNDFIIEEMLNELTEDETTIF